MGSEELKDELVKHIDEAYAMEQNVLRMLDGMIETTDYPETRWRRSSMPWDKFAELSLKEQGVTV